VTGLRKAFDFVRIIQPLVLTVYIRKKNSKPPAPKVSENMTLSDSCCFAAEYVVAVCV
jgi:hypothetical protein